MIALHLATRYQKKLAGVMALSTYMCEPQNLAAEAVDTNRDTPIMMAHGEQDEVVPMFLGNAAYKVLKENGFNATWTTYTIQHNVCLKELNDISEFIQQTFA